MNDSYLLEYGRLKGLVIKKNNILDMEFACIYIW